MLVLTLVVHEIAPFMILFWFTDDIKRLPSIEQAVWHKDSKYNLMVLLCSNGNTKCSTMKPEVDAYMLSYFLTEELNAFNFRS